MRLRSALLAVVLALTVAVGGCGKGKTVAVSGIVTLDGQPVEGASVQLVPLDPEKGMVAQGQTGSDGRFRLTTKKPNDGALPGEYKVLVTFEEKQDPPPGVGGGQGGAMRPDMMAGQFQSFTEGQKKDGGGGQPKKKATKIPARYGDPQNPAFPKVIVPLDGELKLELKSTGG